MVDDVAALLHGIGEFLQSVIDFAEVTSLVAWDERSESAELVLHVREDLVGLGVAGVALDARRCRSPDSRSGTAAVLGEPAVTAHRRLQPVP